MPDDSRPAGASGADLPKEDTRCYSPSWYVQSLPNLESSLQNEREEWLKAIDGVTGRIPGFPTEAREYFRNLIEQEPQKAAEQIKKLFPGIITNSQDAGEFRQHVDKIRTSLRDFRSYDTLERIHFQCTIAIWNAHALQYGARRWGASLPIYDLLYRDYLECLQWLCAMTWHGSIALSKERLFAPPELVSLAGCTARNYFELTFDVTSRLHDGMCRALAPVDFACYQELISRGDIENAKFAPSFETLLEGTPRAVQFALDFEWLDGIAIHHCVTQQLQTERAFRLLVVSTESESNQPESGDPRQAAPTEPVATPSPTPTTTTKASGRYEAAYQSFKLASDTLGHEPTDAEAYEWLKENGPEEYKLPAFETWVRYVRGGRRFHQEQKNSPRGGRTGRSIAEARDIYSADDD